MNSKGIHNRVPSDSPIPTTLKRKRGPSHSDGTSGDLPGGKPALKQNKDEHDKYDEMIQEAIEQDDEESDADSDSSTSLSLPTDEEAIALRSRLRQIGPPAFEEECLQTKQMDMRAVGTVLGIPSEFADIDDDDYLRYFRGIMLYITSKRQKLAHVNTIDDAANLLTTSSKILLITGAGISTSLGIPDFRSKQSGFYAKLSAMGYQEPEEVFDIGYFDDDPRFFYSLAADILPNGNHFTPTHAFIRLLQDKNRLQTNYTQNIDNLEGLAGISPDKLLQCHGSFATASCRKCAHRVPGEAIFADIRAKQVAFCKKCEADIAAKAAEPKKIEKKKKKKSRSQRSGSSSSSGSDDSIPTPGVMKPDITFFGEDLPTNFFARFNDTDCDAADLVIVIGTSMQVAPVAKMPDKLAQAGRGHVPCIYIGHEPCNHIDFDVQLIGDCDAVVWELARRAGWGLVHEMVPAEGLELVVEAVEGQEGVWTVRKKGEEVERVSE